ncbi:MAG: hypothetical protein AAF637_09395 [Pseudomonadota bacterium]
MGAFSSLASTGLNLALSQQAASAQASDARKERNQRIQELQARSREETRKRREELRRRLAAERARAGAAGVATAGGSSDAVLRGLVEQNDAVNRSTANSVNRQINALRQDARSSRRDSLLNFAGGFTNSLLGTSGNSSLLNS